LTTCVASTFVRPVCIPTASARSISVAIVPMSMSERLGHSLNNSFRRADFARMDRMDPFISYLNMEMLRARADSETAYTGVPGEIYAQADLIRGYSAG